MMTPEAISTLIQDVTDLVALSNGEREVIAAALQSVMSAMSRVAPEARVELQTLMAAFIADPEDKDVMAKIGAMLLAARQSDH